MSVSQILGAGFTGLDIINLNKKMYLPGGSCTNVMSILANLGFKTILMKAKYSDIWDSFVDNKLISINVKPYIFKRTIKETPRVVETIENKCHKFYTTCPQCNKYLIDLVLPSKKDVASLYTVLSNSSMLYYDRLSPGINLLIEKAYKECVWTFYEPNAARSYNTLLSNALRSNIVKFSTDRISLKVANQLLLDNNTIESNLKVLIVTKGDRGSLVAYREDDSFSDWISYESVTNASMIVDTSGAGDWFSAGFIYKLLKQAPSPKKIINNSIIQAAMEEGVKLSSECCLHIGALSCLFHDNNSSVLLDNNTPLCSFCYRVR